jgi:hypothetical protein
LQNKPGHQPDNDQWLKNIFSHFILPLNSYEISNKNYKEDNDPVPFTHFLMQFVFYRLFTAENKTPDHFKKGCLQ